MKSVSAILIVLWSTVVIAQAGRTPDGWLKRGSVPQDYEVGTDDSVRRSGAASAYVKAVAETAKGFGTLMQTFDAHEYRGKRLRLSGHLRAVGVKGEAGLWLRVDGPNRQRPLGFDNTQRRVPVGPNWTRAEIVLDVPEDATLINFGLLLAGPGQVWVDDIELTDVPRDVPTTDKPTRLPSGPTNLNFERRKPPTTHDE